MTPVEWILGSAGVLILLQAAFLVGYALGGHDVKRQPVLNETVRGRSLSA